MYIQATLVLKVVCKRHMMFFTGLECQLKLRTRYWNVTLATRTRQTRRKNLWYPMIHWNALVSCSNRLLHFRQERMVHHCTLLVKLFWAKPVAWYPSKYCYQVLQEPVCSPRHTRYTLWWQWATVSAERVQGICTSLAFWSPDVTRPHIIPSQIGR